MKKQVLILFLVFFAYLAKAQYPVVENFDPGTTWIYTNGAGMQNYGPPENYATFNVGATPYPDNATVTITSPVYDISDCFSGLNVSFPLSGLIDNNDLMSFQYNNGVTWVTVATYTGFQNSTYTYATIPNSAIGFRFILVTDGPNVWWYKPSLNGAPKPASDASHTVPVDLSTEYVAFGSINVYYYDIASFTINCTTVLPIELFSFTGVVKGDNNILNWTTATETNNDYFSIGKSSNGYDFESIGQVRGAGNSTMSRTYKLVDDSPFTMTYYTLSQTDYNGTTVKFNPIAVSRANTKLLKVIKITNLLGQDVSDDAECVKIYYYDNGSIRKSGGKL